MENTEIFINNFRLDGRKSNEIRPQLIKMGIIKDSRGSCLYTVGETKILAWINGPKESMKMRNTIENEGVVKCNFSIASFADLKRKADYKRNLQMREFSLTLKEVFEEVINWRFYKRSEVEINVIVLQNDGSYKSSSINAVTLALINAGILIKDTIIGISIGLIDDKYIVDLCYDEEKLKCPIMNCAYLPSFKKFVFLEMSNSVVDYKYSEELLKQAEQTGEIVYNEIKDYLKNEYLK